MKIYFYLLLFFFINLRPMENALDQVFNKEQLSLLELLPQDVWLIILDYLNYKENRKTFINFWGPIVGVGNLNSKNLVIDLYKFAILNSENLNDWFQKIENIGKSWKNERSVLIIRKHLDILNKDFYQDIEKFKLSTLSLDNLIIYYTEKNKILFEKYELMKFSDVTTNFTKIVSTDKNMILALIIFKKMSLLMNNQLDFKKCIMNIKNYSQEKEITSDCLDDHFLRLLEYS